MNVMPPLKAPSPPKARPVQYKAPLGTRWEKEKAGIPKGSFELSTDPTKIGPWILGECVGKGASGRVKVARHEQTGQMAAVKILPLEAVIASHLSMRSKENKAEKHRNGIDKEIIMMKLMNHPNIVRIYDVFEGEKELFLVLEYVDGGELFDYLVNHGRMEALKGLCYFKQIIYGLAYAHAFSIIHRDLKPENILIASLNPPHVKIADWGMAAFAPPDSHLETSCGSPHYASPEIVRGEPYSGTATDIWSCGVILFALMTGRLPFDDKNIRSLLQKVRGGKFEIPSYVFPEAADLIRRMLVVDVDKRIKMQEILTHPFLNHTTPGINYVAAPSIAELDRPLRSRALIKQDLISSLILICGGASYEEVVGELLSPAGQGSLTKVLYFLLARHRERTLEEYGMQNAVYNDGQSIRHYNAPPLKNRPASSAISGDSSASTVMPSPTQASRVAPAPPVPHVPLSPPNVTSPDLSSNSRSRPPSPMGPRSPRSSQQKSRPISSPVPSLMRHVNHVAEEAHSVQDGTGSPRPSKVSGRVRPRTQTVDGLPMGRQAFNPGYVPPDHYHPGSPRPPQNTPSRGLHFLPYTDLHEPTRSPVVDGVGSSWLVKPTVDNPDLQRAIDDIAGRFNVLVTRENRDSLNASYKLTEGNPCTSENKRTSLKKLQLVAEKQNILQDPQRRNSQTQKNSFRYSHANRRSINLSSSGQDDMNKENKDENGCSTSISSSTGTGDDSYLKIDIQRDIGLEKGTRSRARSFTKRSKASLESSNSDDRTANRQSAGQSLAGLITPASASAPPAVVGEVKGWFANLFNWKAQQYVLHSADNCLTTRDEVTRLLQTFGCHVVLEDAQHWGVLKCKMDEIYDLTVGSVTMKSVRFRIEFSPIVGYVRHHAHTNSTSSSVVNSGNAGAVNGGSGVRANAKHSMPIASSLVLVQEKGALSTFKYVYQRMRAEWGRENPLQSPEIGSGGVTPMAAGTPRLR